MKLLSDNGNAFELRIVRYQYPAKSGCEYDDNWLIIEIDVTHPNGAWVSRDPSLLTNEVAALSKWLREIEQGNNKTDECEFIEPNLKFRLSNDRENFFVYFELESRPNWMPTTYNFDDDLFVAFPIADVNLMLAAENLDHQLLNCPPR